MSAVLPTSNPAVTAASRASARASAINDRAAGKEEAGAPFSDLMGTGPAEIRTTGSEAKASKAAKTDNNDQGIEGASNDRDRDERDRDEDDTAKAADATQALPAWLQALREPPPALPPPGSGVVVSLATGADSDDAAALSALAGGSGGSRVLKADAGVLASSLPTTGDTAAGGFDSALVAAADANAATMARAEPAFTPSDQPLTTDQNMTLSAALDQLASKAELPVSLAAAVGNERSTAAVTVAMPQVDAGSLAAAGQPPALDAFGEPLALDGPDAAVRLGERLRWLSEAGVQEARLQLHPKELGAIDVRIRVEHQTANVWFGADHPAARAALESTLPQLRERLAADGLQLGQAQIGTQAQSQRQGGHQDANGESQSGAPAWGRMINGRDDQRVAVTAASERLAAAVARHRGLVDRYA